MLYTTYLIQLSLIREVLKTFGKAHRIEVLKALNESPNGMKYSSIQYDVVRTSGTNLILKEVIDAQLVQKEGDLYVITQRGREALAHVTMLASLEEK